MVFKRFREGSVVRLNIIPVDGHWDKGFTCRSLHFGIFLYGWSQCHKKITKWRPFIEYSSGNSWKVLLDMKSVVKSTKNPTKRVKTIIVEYWSLKWISTHNIYNNRDVQTREHQLCSENRSETLILWRHKLINFSHCRKDVLRLGSHATINLQ